MTSYWKLLFVVVALAIGGISLAFAKLQPRHPQRSILPLAAQSTIGVRRPAHRVPGQFAANDQRAPRVDRQSHQRHRHAPQRCRSGVARIRHHSVHAPCHQHQPSRASHRRLDLARNWLRRLA